MWQCDFYLTINGIIFMFYKPILFTSYPFLNFNYVILTGYILIGVKFSYQTLGLKKKWQS